MADVAGLGAVAGGFSRGMMMGQDYAARRQAMNWQAEQMQRERKRLAEEDAARQDLMAANAAGMKVIKGYRDAYDQQNADPQAGIAAGLAGQQAPAPVAPFKPSQDQIMEAAQARTDHLFAVGRTDLAVQHWIQDEQLRRGLREQSIQKGLMAYQASGDPSGLIKDVYKNINDGWDITDVKAQRNVDGTPSWVITRQRQTPGPDKKPVVDTKTITPDQIEGLTQWALDPKAAAQYALQSKAEAWKATEAEKKSQRDQQKAIELEAERGRQARQTETQRAGSAVGLERVKGEEARKTAAAKAKLPGAAGSNKIHSVGVDAEGYKIATYADGTTERLTINGQPVRSNEWATRVDRVAADLGKSLEGAGKKPAELRDQAEQLLLNSAGRIKTAPAGLPKGSKYIGTSNGKSVWQTPDGKRLIED